MRLRLQLVFTLPCGSKSQAWIETTHLPARVLRNLHVESGAQRLCNLYDIDISTSVLSKSFEHTQVSCASAVAPSLEMLQSRQNCQVTCQVLYWQARRQPVLQPVRLVDRLMVRLPARLFHHGQQIDDL